MKGGDICRNCIVYKYEFLTIKLRSMNMIMNKLRGTVADRPIDSQVVQPDSDSTMNHISSIHRAYPIQQVDVSRTYPPYDKGWNLLLGWGQNFIWPCPYIGEINHDTSTES